MEIRNVFQKAFNAIKHLKQFITFEKKKRGIIYDVFLDAVVIQK